MNKTLAGALVLAAISCKSHDESVSLDLTSNEDTATRMHVAMDEGEMGSQMARQQAIEQARNAGVLGSTALSRGGAFASGFDDTNIAAGFVEEHRNGWTDAKHDHLSTFAADVDTASYTLARRLLLEGDMPDPRSVRVEEFVNYFKYALPPPRAGTPFGVAMNLARSPYDDSRYFLRVGVSTQPIAPKQRKPAHLVFLVDTSGSMDEPDRLPLAKSALRILTDNLGDDDTVALVTYAGDSSLVLPVTSASHKDKIRSAIDDLGAGGSTAMASGIDLAYELAGVEPGYISRVIVCTDGDANVGPHTPDELLALIGDRAKRGVTLSTIGFGVGNYQDHLMEQLADKGNGNNFYIDSIGQARRVFAEQLGSTLEVVAKDAKLQVDFDPAAVSRYRLVGYDNRDIADADFRNDRVDAGEIGAGHQVTAIYELELTDGNTSKPPATLRVRWKQPDGDTASEAAFPLDGDATPFFSAPADVRFAVAVASFADVLRGNSDWKLPAIYAVAAAAAGDDPDRVGFVQLVAKAITLGHRS